MLTENGSGSDTRNFEAGGPMVPGQADMNVQPGAEMGAAGAASAAVPAGGLNKLLMQRASQAGMKKKKGFLGRMGGMGAAMGGGMAGLGLAKKSGGAGMGAAGALLGTKMGKAGVGAGIGTLGMGGGMSAEDYQRMKNNAEYGYGGRRPGMPWNPQLMDENGNVVSQPGGAMGGAMQGYRVGEMDPTAGFNMGGGAQAGFDGGNGMSPEMKAKVLEQLGGAGRAWGQAKKRPIGSDVQQMEINQAEADRLAQVPQPMGEVPVSQWRS